ESSLTYELAPSGAVTPDGLERQYSATVAWAVERDGLHTRLNLVAAGFTRNKRGPFQAHLTLYTDEHPDGLAWLSPPAQFDRDLRIELATAFPDVRDGY